MLKKLTMYIVLAVLCPFFGMGQVGNSGSVGAAGLKSGDLVPDVALPEMYNYRGSGGEKVSGVRLSDFKGKLLILDFWATWCAPCVGMLPRLDSLQREFGEKVAIVSVSYQGPDVVLPFIEKRERARMGGAVSGRVAGSGSGADYGGSGRFSMPMVVGDTKLGALFPHAVLPHYVWIDAAGRLLGSTGMEELRSDRISSVLAGKGFSGAQKTDEVKRVHDRARLLVEQGLVVDSTGGFFYSSMGRYIPGLLPKIESFAASEKFGVRIVATNYMPIKLMQASFLDRGEFDMRNTVLELADQLPIRPVKGSDVGAWRKGHGVCYERTVPLGADLYGWMKMDMKTYFPAYAVSVASRRMKCLALVETDSLGRYRASGTGKPVREISEEGSVFRFLGLKHFISPLFRFYLQGIPMPIVDATGFKGLIDIRIDGSLRDLKGINRALAGYGLKFEERMMETEVLVIADVVIGGKGKGDE